MNRIARAAVLAALVSLIAPSTLAEATPLREIWLETTSQADRADIAKRDATLEDLFRQGKTLGISRYPMFAESASSMALEAEAIGDRERAKWAIDTAHRLDPESATVAFTAADLARRQGNWSAIPGELIRGAMNVFRDHRTKALARADLAIAAIFAIGAGILVFAIVQFLLYHRVAAHEFREILGSKMRSGPATVAGFAMLFLPLFIWLDPVWLAIYWLMIFMIYSKLSEQIIAVILLLLTAMIPPALDRVSHRMVGIGTPVIEAAASHLEASYDIDAVRRLRELISLQNDDAGLRLLLGNLEYQLGNEREAAMQYKKAIEIYPASAGAHVNLGNLHFLSNDLVAATLEYQLAAESDPSMAIAHYNASVAFGQLYRFDKQSEQLGLARQKDRILLQRIVANPPQNKIVVYRMPIEEAWAIAERTFRNKNVQGALGNFATFDLRKSITSPLSAGCLVAIIVGVSLRLRRGRAGFAGECIKCGRAFCYRCKSAQESTAYCTQCVHIYLKRDGVSLETKRSKMAEVQAHQASSLRRKKIFASALPGSAQILDGAPIRGTIALLAFLFFVSIAYFVGRLAPIAMPAETMKLLLRCAAVFLALVTWLLISLPVFRQKPAQAGV